MSRNGSGVYSLPAGNPVVTGTTISSSWANTTLSDIATALTGSVASDGQTPMTGNLQMGSNKVTGLAAGTVSTDAVNYGQLTGGTEAGVFTNVTDSALTSGRVVYTSTGGLLASSANLLYSGTDLTVYGITVGRGAGAVSTNTAVGASALAANTSGYVNSSFGYAALAANTTGWGNSALGREALNVNTTGLNNTSIGASSLANNTTGNYNSALGYAALLNNTTASYNTAVGYQAAYTNTGGGICAIGAQVLKANTTGTSNTAVGGTYQYEPPLYSNTTGQRNTAIGEGSLAFNTTGSYNTGLGTASLYSNTTASNNTAVGYQAGYTNSTGYNNVAVGYQSLYSNTTGYENNATGVVTLYANTTGAFNSSYGNASLRYNTTGNYNTAMGVNALYSNTTASNNTAVGYQAGYSNTTGSPNTYIGYQAGYSGSTNNACTAIGFNTLYANTGNGNTAVGGGDNATYGGALSSNTTGVLNTAIGAGSGSAITTGSRNSILGRYNGNQGGLDIRTASNKIVISDGDGVPQIVVGAYMSSSGTYTLASSVFSFGNGTNLNTTDGIIALNGNDYSGRGPYIFGNANGSAKWQIGSYSAVISGTNQYFTCMNTSGGVYLNGASATSWTAVSDETRKVIIEDITDGANKVASLRTVIGRLKTDDESVRRPYLIAQDVQAVLPEAVTQTEDKEGAVLGLSYTEVIPLLVAAIKELKAEVDSLKQQLGK